ncbi:putative methionine transporter, NhaC family [Alkalispirochaeta americana]|uniref:Putative methionine transporter, NhaC family n=1 Tax=Alkalispirochaeta americana TaxID=159291 RepID=A0A1N6RGM7_9SPIO|nr:Na+/H+ antiporter NhaC family protein [Alkalispirochaeta americana]SIQ28020.1 putative methionine transporter, NhaC family [Alkalispirochaeta americana]
MHDTPISTPEAQGTSPGNTPSCVALLPLLLFLALFIGTGAALTLRGTSMAFYQLSAAVAVLPALVLSLLLGMGRSKTSLDTQLATFVRGVGDSNIITMCLIYLLAGAFASVATSIGGVTSTVNLGLALVPPAFVLPGLFLIAAFVSTAMGTSMGTIAAVAPIAVGVGEQTSVALPLLMGAVVGGAMFGDNLSMISDTTIAATRTQECQLKDKFRVNLYIALPAALAAVLVFAILGADGTITEAGDYRILTALPYLVILGMALAGVNVFAVLATGILFTGVVGLTVVPGYAVLQFSRDIFQGFQKMQEIMVLSMFIGGLGELIRDQGGIAWILGRIDRITARSRGKNRRRTGELSIAGLVSAADICTANNTVAIILSGGLAQEIARKNGVDPRRSASILDVFSCVFQGIMPYAAQVLLAGSVAGISPVAIVGNNYYCFILALAGCVAIASGRPRFSRRS